MTTREAYHQNSRMCICGVCFRKSKYIQKITPLILTLIQKHKYNNYSLEDQALPLVICKLCANVIKVVDSDQPNRKLPDFDYDSLVKPTIVNTRLGDKEKCHCTICDIFQLNGHKFKNYAKSQRSKPGRPAEKVSESCYPISQCSSCHSEMGSGKVHECTRAARHDNLVYLVRCQSEKT